MQRLEYLFERKYVIYRKISRPFFCSSFSVMSYNRSFDDTGNVSSSRDSASLGSVPWYSQGTSQDTGRQISGSSGLMLPGNLPKFGHTLRLVVGKHVADPREAVKVGGNVQGSMVLGRLEEYVDEKTFMAPMRLIKESAGVFRKGACENCGAMSHDKKNCFSRPRARGAKVTNKNIMPDEEIMDPELDFEGKRDRWNGYNNAEYKKHVEAWERMEAIRKKKKEAEIAAGKADKLAKGEAIDSDDSDEGEDSEMKDGGEVIQEVDEKHKTKQTVRNLRIREDTAKFLKNIYSDTYYDAKTRSMRGNPFPDQDPNSVCLCVIFSLTQLVYAGDNFMRATGDTQKFNQLEVFSWQAADHGQNIHIASNPSLAEMLFQQHKQKKEAEKNNVKKDIIEKYGGVEHLQKNAVSQAETYVEFAPDGRVIKGVEVAIPKSKYSEDVLEKNHSFIWGSFYNDGQWGYACCSSTLRNSYCVGEKGKELYVAGEKNDSDKKRIFDEVGK